MISRRQVADLNKNMKAFKKKNAQLVVIGNGNIVHYVYRSQKAGDHPPTEEVLQACSV